MNVNRIRRTRSGRWPTILPIPTHLSGITGIRLTVPTTVWTILRPPPGVRPSCPTRPSIGPRLPYPRPSAHQLMLVCIVYTVMLLFCCVCALRRDDDNNNNNTTNTNHHYFLIHQSGTWRKNSPFSTPGSNGHNATPSIFDMTANNSLNTTGNSSFSNMDMSLALSPATPSQEARSKLLRPKNLIERARLNVA